MSDSTIPPELRAVVIIGNPPGSPPAAATSKSASAAIPPAAPVVDENTLEVPDAEHATTADSTFAISQATMPIDLPTLPVDHRSAHAAPTPPPDDHRQLALPTDSSAGVIPALDLQGDSSTDDDEDRPPNRHDPLPVITGVASLAATTASPPGGEPVITALPPLLFEIAWEVCWQLGGIYTVLRTKVEQMLHRWGDRYILIGPYNPQTAALEFEEATPEGTVRQALEALSEMGLSWHYGRWLVPGRPRVILLDYRSRFGSLGQDKYLLWKDHGISTTADDGEVNEVVAFGFTIVEFFRALTAAAPSRPVVAHFHEWMSGVAVPRIAHEHIPVQTVFTTHATLLGRYLAGDSPQFYDHLPFINPDAEASKYLIHPRFAIERAAAHAATVFTTVSEVTGTEAEKLLGRRPEVILPNGLNIHRFAALHEFQNLHRQYKEVINEFVMGHFFPAYNFDLDRTIYIFTSGRYEYGNKGMDLFIEALYQVNQRLRGMADRPTIVAFIITKAPVRNINVGVLQNRTMFEELESACNQVVQLMGRRLFRVAANGRLPTMGDLLDDDSMVRLKQTIHAWRHGRQPTIVTHDLWDDQGDPILRHLRHRQLFNAADDPVKVIFHPQFISPTGPLLNMEYEQFVRGCHMGVFPSYYEPWGYTPMESVAMGVPAVTTDLSGFGAYVQRHIMDHETHGIHVLTRRGRPIGEAISDLADHIIQFTSLSRRQRIELRNKVERLGERFDWSILITFYNQAHDLALSRRSESVGRLDVRLV
jgi:glycogen(starch) synthase